MTFKGNLKQCDIYNFLDPKLSPTVSANAPCMDGYEAENLMSTNYLAKARGFVAYSHVKPPVDVEFNLLCPIDIHYIKIHSVVGSQKASGITILAPEDESLIEVGQGTYKEDGIIFYNLKHHLRKHLPPNPNNFATRYFKHQSNYAIAKCNRIILRIFKTDRTVPCLANVEVWGTVARSCPLVTVNTIHCLMNKAPEEQANEIDEERREFNFKVPDEFLDALTYDVMSLPMTLPSGHNIDQTTLDKCINNDSNYGRQPCDPFTGLKFTSVRKPVFNTSLKTRIDMYLMENSHQEQLFNVKRTLGKKRMYDSQEVVVDCDRKKLKSVQNVEKKRYEETIVTKSADETLSLDDAINRALNSENFLRFTVERTDNDRNEPVAAKCCVLCKSKENVYVVPCEHLFCRSCLLTICEAAKCSVCDKGFVRGDVKKIHI